MLKSICNPKFRPKIPHFISTNFWQVTFVEKVTFIISKLRRVAAMKHNIFCDSDGFKKRNLHRSYRSLAAKWLLLDSCEIPGQWNRVEVDNGNPWLRLGYCLHCHIFCVFSLRMRQLLITIKCNRSEVPICLIHDRCYRPNTVALWSNTVDFIEITLMVITDHSSRHCNFSL